MSEQRTLHGKRAVVTGAGRGIGRAEALALAEAGAAVVVNYGRSKDAALEVVGQIRAAGGSAEAIGADIADPDAVTQLMNDAAERLGGIDILCSNAGIEHFGALEQVTPADFDRVFAVNTRGQLFVVKEAFAHMGAGGRIVCTSSMIVLRDAQPVRLHRSTDGAIRQPEPRDGTTDAQA
jgi:NAD(P)-dependent dehydrogenase (short-subunit alcohol dehydrogenase family)